jgi:lipopolysaccharide transport system permease protein
VLAVSSHAADEGIRAATAVTAHRLAQGQAASVLRSHVEVLADLVPGCDVLDIAAGVDIRAIPEILALDAHIRVVVVVGAPAAAMSDGQVGQQALDGWRASVEAALACRDKDADRVAVLPDPGWALDGACVPDWVPAPAASGAAQRDLIAAHAAAGAIERRVGVTASGASDDTPEQLQADTDPRRQAVTTYTPQSTWSLGYLRAWQSILAGVRDHRGLIWQLFKRDFVGSYRSSYLGVSWLLIAPLLSIIQWLVIERNGVLRTGDTSVPYPVYVLLGTTMWTAFIGFYTAAAATLRSSARLLVQVRFPRESLIFKQAGGQAAIFAASLIVSLVVLVATGVAIRWPAVLVPVAVVPMVLFATAVGLVSSMFTVVAVDLDRVLRIFWGLMMWLSPVVYVLEDRQGVLGDLARWNPLTYLVLEPRSLLIDGGLSDPARFAGSAALAVVSMVVAGRLFHVSEPQLVERLL